MFAKQIKYLTLFKPPQAYTIHPNLAIIALCSHCHTTLTTAMNTLQSKKHELKSTSVRFIRQSVFAAAAKHTTKQCCVQHAMHAHAHNMPRLVPSGTWSQSKDARQLVPSLFTACDTPASICRCCQLCIPWNRHLRLGVGLALKLHCAQLLLPLHKHTLMLH